MMTTETLPAIACETSIDAPADRVFAALIEPEQMLAWWGDDETMRLTNMESDLRIGGKWRCTGVMSNGEPFVVEGIYRTIEPPRLLEHTWKYEADSTETLVRFELDERNGSTHVKVTHSGFTDPEERADHERGWIRVLGWLNAYATKAA